MSLRTITIARIAAIPIQVHWSWIGLSVVLIVFLQPFYASQLQDGSAWLAAGAAALLLLVSVLLHEAGHALAAHMAGLRVRSVTLMAMGGITEMSDEGVSPLRELVVALGGPLVTLLLTLGGALVWWLSPAPLVSLLALQTVQLNALLLVFNLLPGYLLDGGRILRAVLWFLMDDELQAAQMATQFGRACGWLLILGGVAHAILARDPLNGAWVVLTGYLVNRTTTIGLRQFLLRRALHGVRVADVMQRIYRSVTPDLRLDQFVGSYVLGQSDQGFPVLRSGNHDEQNQWLGMITVRNLRRFTLKEWSLTRVSDAMTPAAHVRTLSPHTPAQEAFLTLLRSGEEQLPVVENNTLLGILRRRDLLQHIQRRMSNK